MRFVLNFCLDKFRSFVAYRLQSQAAFIAMRNSYEARLAERDEIIQQRNRELSMKDSIIFLKEKEIAAIALMLEQNQAYIKKNIAAFQRDIAESHLPIMRQ